MRALGTVISLAALCVAAAQPYGQVEQQFGNVIVTVGPGIVGVDSAGDKINGTKNELTLGISARFDPQMGGEPYDWCHLYDIDLTIGGEAIPYDPVEYEPGGGAPGGNQHIPLREWQNVRFASTHFANGSLTIQLTCTFNLIVEGEIQETQSVTATIAPEVYNKLLAYGTTKTWGIPPALQSLGWPDEQEEDIRLIGTAQSAFSEANYVLEPSSGIHFQEPVILAAFENVTSAVISTHGTTVDFKDSYHDYEERVGTITLFEVDGAHQIGMIPDCHLVFMYSCSVAGNDNAPGRFHTMSVGGALCGFEVPVEFYLIEGNDAPIDITKPPRGLQMSTLADHWSALVAELQGGVALEMALSVANDAWPPREELNLQNMYNWSSINMVIAKRVPNNIRVDGLSTLKWVYMEPAIRDQIGGMHWYIKT